MTTIKYTPITGSTAFGDPGSLFESATKTLAGATSGLEGAFNTIRQGAIQDRDKRTQEAISDIQRRIQTEAQFNEVAPQLGGAEDIQRAYGSANIDANKVLNALQSQRGAAREAEAAEYTYQQGLNQRADAERLNALQNQLVGKSAADIRRLIDDPSTFEGFSNVTSAREQLAGYADTVFNREENILKAADAARERGKRSFEIGLFNDPALVSDPTAPEGLDDFNKRQAHFNQQMHTARSSRQYTPNEIANLEKNLKESLGITPTREAEALFRSLPRDAQGRIKQSDIIRIGKEEGLSDQVLQNQINSYNNLTGETARKAEADRQTRRQEAYEDAMRLNASPTLLQDYIIETFTDTDIIMDDALDSAVSAKDAALKAGYTPLQIQEALFAGTEVGGDFNRSNFNKSLKKHATTKARKELHQTIEDSRKEQEQTFSQGFRG